MDKFVFWLAFESTLVTVVVPLFIGAVGLSAMSLRAKWRRELLPMALYLVLIAVLCMPLMHATSFWSDKGLHIAPIELLPFLYLVAKKGLDVRRQWLAIGFASWFSGVVPDVLGSWIANYPGSSWYWGVGGYGYDDGLFVAPLVCIFSLLMVQAVLERWYLAPMSAFNFSRA